MKGLPGRCSVGWHLSVQLDTSGLQFPLSVRLTASVSRTEVVSLDDSTPHVPPATVPPIPEAASVALVGVGSGVLPTDAPVLRRAS